MDASGAPSSFSYLSPGGAIDNLILHPIDTISTAYDEAKTTAKVYNAIGNMSVGDYTLVGVGIVLAIGALLISAKPVVVKAAGTVKDAVTF